MNRFLIAFTCLALSLVPANVSRAAVRSMTDTEMHAATGGYQETGRCKPKTVCNSVDTRSAC